MLAKFTVVAESKNVILQDPRTKTQQNPIKTGRFCVLVGQKCSRKLDDQTGQKTTVPNVKDTCEPDQATHNIAY
jgi:hypothetical protein